jgi:hypothetical protein
MTSLGKVRRLSPRDRGLLFRSLLLLPAIHAALLLFGYCRLQTALETLIPLKKVRVSLSRQEILQEAQTIAEIIDIAARHGIYKATCLRRSLIAWWFLRERGFPSQICFGVRLVDQKLEAHAWVEYSGVIVNDSADTCSRYQPLYDVLPPSELGL